MARLLIIQIPCFNEQDQIEACLHSLPRVVPGFSEVQTLVVDDGSQDATVQAARQAGADHILMLGQHRGLAQAFYLGLKHAFTALHADAIVNFDADLQYLPGDIPRLVEPVALGEADYVLGERRFAWIDHWTQVKKGLQKAGAIFLSLLCGQRFNDVTTGFRVVNREAGLRLSVLSQYTYTIETLIHAVNQNLRVRGLPVFTRPTATRPSRLIRSTAGYCLRAVRTATVTLLRYRAFEVFLAQSVLFLAAAVAAGLCFFFRHTFWTLTPREVLDLSRMFLVLSVLLLVAAIMSDNIVTNHRVVEELRYEQRLREIARDTVRSESPRHLTQI